MSSSVEALRRLNHAYISGNYLSAETGIQRALEKWPTDPNLLQLGALTALQTNQIVTAHQRSDIAMSLIEMTAEFANVRGRIFKAAGEWALAEQSYRLAQKLDPKFDKAKLNLLNLLVVSEQPKRVLEELGRGFDFGPVGDIAKAQALSELGEYDEALKTCNSLTSKGYEDQTNLIKIKCHAGLGNLTDMELIYDQLKPQSSYKVKALIVLVNWLEMQGRRAQADTVIDTVLQSNEPALMVEAVRLLRRVDGTMRAENALNMIVRNHPENLDIMLEHGHSLRLGGEVSESCEIFKKALLLSPGNGPALTGYAQSSILAGQYDDAQFLLQSALAQSPNNQFLLALVATLLRAKGGHHTGLYDYKNMVKAYDIAVPEGFGTIEAFNQSLSTCLSKFHTHKQAPINQTLRIGTQTERDLSLVDDPVLRAFFRAIDAPIKKFMAAIGTDANHPMKRRNTGSYRISGAWSVKLRENGHHVNHVHPMGWISSSYYVDVPQSVSGETKDGWIKFGEPNFDIGQKPEHFVQPKPGRLVLFPSYMWHGTIPFSGDQPRLTLPFDVVPG